MQKSKSSKHHRSASLNPSGDQSNQYFNGDSSHQTPNSTSLSSTPCSAYFLHRLDLADYTMYTLEQTVDSVVSGAKSKGLKVKISLPNEGLIIDNVPDPNQSWMYKTSKLLFFWRDPYYANIIVVITINRSRYRFSGPYSASIFRLRGNESAELFLQRAQQVFSQLPASHVSRTNSKTLLAKSNTIEKLPVHHKKKDHGKRSKHHSPINEQTVDKRPQSVQAKPIRLITRAEFDPGRTKTDAAANHRTYSETTVSSDAHTTSSNKRNNDDDDKMTTVSNNISSEHIDQLMRELKELRYEIASLKLDARFTPVRSISTSPLAVFAENPKQRRDFSPMTCSDVDAETQTDFNLVNPQRKKLSKKTITNTDENAETNKRKNEQSKITFNKRTSSGSSNNIESDREEIEQINSSQLNGSSNGETSSRVKKQYQPTVFASSSSSNSILTTNKNGFTHLNGSTTYTKLSHGQSKSNSTEEEEGEDSYLYGTPLIVEKEPPKVFSKNVSTSMPTGKGEVVSFHSLLENADISPEHIYENVPILIQMATNKNFYYNVPITNKTDQSQSNSYLAVTIKDDRESEVQKKYLAQLFGEQNGISLLLPQQSIKRNSSPEIQETTSVHSPQPQQVLFANHLTNPLFNIDKQLLANTIANQFGVDLNSPHLQQLIQNQHLFAAHKRTFANMVWQMTTEEEKAFCSSPILKKSNMLDINTIDPNSSTAKPILKANNTVRSISKKQRITWDSALE